jgi:hypothetical protein
MKKIYLVLFFFSFCFFTASFDAMSNECADTATQIRLTGNLSSVKIRTSNANAVQAEDVQVFLDDNSLQVRFFSNLGTIAISLYDEYGSIVYQQPVNTFAGLRMDIDISSLSRGEYAIEFVNSQNQYLEGYFEI